MTQSNEENPNCDCQNVEIKEGAIITNENTPLLRTDERRQRNILLGKVWLCSLLVILAVGFVTGAYLLLTENEETTVDGVYNLIPRIDWGAKQPLESSRKLNLPVTRLMFLQTNTSNCFNEKDCTRLIQSLQSEHMLKFNQTDILYNFLITGNGLLYEGRGWEYESYDNHTLIVAFIGDFYNEPLPKNQVLETKVFIDSATAQGYLVQCFDYIVHNDLPLRRYFFDGVNEIVSLRKKVVSCI